jgi:hypothetical protein
LDDQFLRRGETISLPKDYRNNLRDKLKYYNRLEFSSTSPDAEIWFIRAKEDFGFCGLKISFPYYVKDVIYCLNDEGIVYRGHSGSLVGEDESHGEERISRFYIKETEYDIEVDNDFFALPYDGEEE